MVYVVSYDLRKPNRDYTELYTQLQNSQAWWHFLESTWLIDTSESATQLYNRLANTIDQDDSLLVIEAGPQRQGWLPDEAWRWIDEHLT